MRTALAIAGWLLFLGSAPGCYGVASDYVGGDGEGGGPGAAPVYYRPQIQADLEAAKCTTCHAGTAPMKVTPAPSSDAQWQANHREASQRAEGLAPKANGAGGHAKVALDAAVLARWSAWAAQGAPYRAAPVSDAGFGGGGGAADAGHGGGAAGAADAGTGGGSAGGTGGGAAMDAGRPVTWEADIRAVMVSEGCTTCHGGSTPSASYALGTYPQAMGNGKDLQPNVVPGDPVSTLVIFSRSGHEGMSAANALKVLRWVVDWEAAER
ncbi:MAG: hypothetical protein IPJ65_14465 [Archangiaceae bacterium]|nr:hypothetical protein [Archangiaceae bacterium]